VTRSGGPGVIVPLVAYLAFVRKVSRRCALMLPTGKHDWLTVLEKIQYPVQDELASHLADRWREGGMTEPDNDQRTMNRPSILRDQKLWMNKTSPGPRSMTRALLYADDGMYLKGVSRKVTANFSVKSASYRTLCGVKRRQAYVEA
jgi:hypothetical protein